MQYSTALSDGVLALACLACAIAIGKARKHYGESDQPALFCALLGFLLPAAAAAVGVIRFGIDPGAQAAHLWLSQASSFLGLPLVGAAALALGRGWQWSRANWGRILLGLCAFFELFRQLNQLEDYRLLLNLATLLLILYAGAVQWPKRPPLATSVTVVGLFLLAGLVVGTQGFIDPLRRVDLFHVLLTLAYPLLAWLLLSLPGSAKHGRTEENPVKTL
ncbi:DUF6962 family protein [Pseudomonas anguilliseptica]|uniref:DUF6962 family protein n=1 Tax=Pseudomonas anguilliseptica TaxID=53406 RepID=UPI001F172956|nr:hypothetical protein [Pseudomonas anguilliseptica]MCE5362277.1 hypothetical protein [Pseudomonas anguilliseptica]